jgi:hypothetical protein
MKKLDENFEAKIELTVEEKHLNKDYESIPVDQIEKKDSAFNKLL